MDESMKKKLMAVGAAALGAFMFGEAPEEVSGSIDGSDHLELNEDDEWVAAPLEEDGDGSQEE